MRFDFARLSRRRIKITSGTGISVALMVERIDEREVMKFGEGSVSGKVEESWKGELRLCERCCLDIINLLIDSY